MYSRCSNIFHQRFSTKRLLSEIDKQQPVWKTLRWHTTGRSISYPASHEYGGNILGLGKSSFLLDWTRGATFHIASATEEDVHYFEDIPGLSRPCYADGKIYLYILSAYHIFIKNLAKPTRICYYEDIKGATAHKVWLTSSG